MPLVYFKKELLSNVLRNNGTPVPFETLGGNTGVIRLNTETDTPLIADLRKIAGTRGVVEINEATYEALKKNRPSNQSAKSYPNGTPALQVLRRDLGPKKQEPASPAVAAAPAPKAPDQPVQSATPKVDPSVAPEPVPPRRAPNLGVPKSQPAPA